MSEEDTDGPVVEQLGEEQLDSERDRPADARPESDAEQRLECDEPLPNLGLALSGGGVRASLFSLGVLIAFVETGANRCVRSIASVSGGSILNAAIAHCSDFSQYNPVSFKEPARKIAKILSSSGCSSSASGLPRARRAQNV